MRDSKFVIHHIGGRAGSRSFPIVPALEHEFVVVMYEASADGNDQIISYGNRKGTGETILVNACVGAPNEERNFYLNRDPYTSSLLKLDPKYADFYMDFEKYDYVMGDAISTVMEEKFLTESLDQIIKSKNLPDCDFLSIDTQGSELEILENAEETLKKCVGVKLEVAFERRYSDQPLFGEIDSFLRDHGFKFIRFTDLKEWAPRTLGTESRGVKLHIETDAIYFKTPEYLLPSQFYPFLLTALVFGQTEYAAFATKSLERHIPLTPISKWMFFCNSFLEIVNKPQKMRQTFSDSMTVEQSFARFVDVDPKTVKVTTLKTGLRKLYLNIPTPLRKFIQKCECWLRKQTSRIKAKRLKPTEIEELFESIGLTKIAKSLKHSRSFK